MSNAMDITELTNVLEQAGLDIGLASDFYGTNESSSEGLWVKNAEDATHYNGSPFFDYYSTSEEYVFGVYEPLHSFLSAAGWYPSAHDAGTYMIYPNG